MVKRRGSKKMSPALAAKSIKRVASNLEPGLQVNIAEDFVRIFGDDALELLAAACRSKPRKSGIRKLWAEARQGNRASARTLLLSFCLDVESKASVPRELLGYLRNGIRRHLEDGTPLEVALHLRVPHRPRGSHGKATDPTRLAALFFLYLRRDGLKRTAAKKKVALECNTNVRTVDNAVGMNSDFYLRNFAELEAMAAVG